MNTKGMVILVIVLVVIFGGWYLLRGGAQTSQAPAAHTTQTTTTTTTTPPTGGVTVTYTDSGFSPSSVSIKVGQSVRWVDQRSSPMWVASDPHPVHTGYDGTSRSQHCAAGYGGAAPFDECSGGTTYTFTFNKVGTWGYHDHISAAASGTVIVTQ